MVSFHSKGQTGITPFLVIGGLLLIVLAFIVLSFLSEPLSFFIELGVNSSGGGFTAFVIKLMPIWIVMILVGMAVYVIASGGGGQ